MTAILDKLTLYFQYPFVRYALIVGVLIALCSSLLGVTLVLKRFSFIGDGLSHVAFGAMAIAAVLNLTNDMPLILCITVGCAVLLLRSGQNTKIKGRGDCDALRWRSCHRVSADEFVLHLNQFDGRCMQHLVWLNFDSDLDPNGGVAVRCAVRNRCGCIHSALSQDFCGHI